MIIDFKNDKLYILDSNNLPSKLKIKLILQCTGPWNFKKDTISNILLREDKGDIEIILPKIIKFCEKLTIPYSLSSSVKDKINKINDVEKKFQLILENARNLKNGEFNNDDFEKHINFLNQNIHRKLLHHQKLASYHLWITKNGANFSVPGAGKTTVALSTYERLRLEGKVNILYVFGPVTCFYPWINEFKETLNRRPSFKILAGGNIDERKFEYHKSKGFSELYLTSFHTLLNDKDYLDTFLSNKDIRPFFVIDEAHYIKQSGGAWANAILQIAKYSKYKYILTGTPMPNKYEDIYNMFEFLWPKQNLLTDQDKFQINYFQDTDQREKIEDKLNNTIGPLFYRVRKKELGLSRQIFLPPILVQMNPIEREIYDRVFEAIKNTTKQEYAQNIQVMMELQKGRMMRLRQAVSYVKLLETAIPDYQEDLYDSDIGKKIVNYEEIPGKITALLNLVKEHKVKNEKVVIWAHFINAIKLIEKTFKENGINCKKIIGETPTQNSNNDDNELSGELTREEIRIEFLNPKSGLDILLANPAACSESISLHKLDKGACYNAIYYDLSYNCAQYLQSLDRIHRVGGSEKQKSYYHFLQYSDTFEPRILDRLNDKAEKMKQIIDKDYPIYSLDFSEDTDIGLHEIINAHN